MRTRATEAIDAYAHWGFGAGAEYDPSWPGEHDARFVLATVETDGMTPLSSEIDGDGCVLSAPLAWRREDWGRRLSTVPMVARHAPIAPGAGTGTTTYRRNPFLHPRTFDETYDAEVADRDWRGSSGPRRPRAILAIVDDGIPFGHSDFRDREGRSRIEGCWLQGAYASADGTGTVPFGRELQGYEIDRMVDLAHDEDVVYRHVREPSRDRVTGRMLDRAASHGAHVLAAAAGHRHGRREPGMPVGGDGDLDDVAILAVQLPSPNLADTAWFGKEALILAAFHYVFDRADRLSARDLPPGQSYPLIVNFSFGFSGGPGDGRDRLGRAIAEMVALRRSLGGVTELVMPSGNGFQHRLLGIVDRSMLRAPKGRARYDVAWRIQPCDRTANFMEIWLPSGAHPYGLGISVRSPDGAEVWRRTWRRGDDAHQPLRRPGDLAQIGQVSVEPYGPPGSEPLWRVVVVLAPTESDGTMPTNVPGAWRIGLSGLDRILRRGPLTCRIQRDESPFAYFQGARQSQFDDPDDEPYAPSGAPAFRENPKGSFVHRFGTINGLAAHDHVLVVAGFRSDTGLPAPYSAAGPLAGAGAGSVHLSARSDISGVTHGTRSSGTRSGTSFALDGTSVASPRIARRLVIACCDKAFRTPPGEGSIALQLLDDALVRTEDAGVVGSPGFAETAAARLGYAMLRDDLVLAHD